MNLSSSQAFRGLVSVGTVRGSCALLAGAFLALLIPASAQAQVNYVREVAVPADVPSVLATVNTPISPDDPQYIPGLDPAQWLISDQLYYRYTTSSISLPNTFPAAVKLNPASFSAISGLGTSHPMAYLLSAQTYELYRYDMTTDALVLPIPFINFINNQATSLAASQKGVVTILADGFGYQVDADTGADTQIFNSNLGGTALGQFSNALFQSFGANGLLYVLDYGNQRVQALDPANAFAPVSQFSLQTGVANMPFAIGPTGDFYFGDGIGGGQAYAADGTYEGAFSTDVSTPNSHLDLHPYVSTDGKGDVFVFDPGAHNSSTPASASCPSPRRGL